MKGKTDYIYLIHDPEDYQIANQIINFLKEKKFRVNSVLFFFEFII
jgi:hypothetical protein